LKRKGKGKSHVRRSSDHVRGDYLPSDEERVDLTKEKETGGGEKDVLQIVD